MAKDNYMALADFQTLWSDRIKPSLTNSFVSYDQAGKKLTKTVAGTTSDVVTALKLAQDAGALLLNPLELTSLPADYTFRRHDALLVGTVLYRCTAESTAKPPFDFVFDDDGKLVVDIIDGVAAAVTDSGTLNAGWEGVIDISDRYYIGRLLAGKADKAETLAGYGIADAYTKDQIVTMMDALTRHTRLTDFDLDVLKQAVADQNLEKYGLKVGDEKTINGRTYVIAGLNCLRGPQGPCTTDHVGLIVIPHTGQKWNASGNVRTGADNRGAGYANSDLHYYLVNTLLPLVQTDLGSSSILTSEKVLSNSVDQQFAGRSPYLNGGSNNVSYDNHAGISALSEVQVYGSIVWSASGFDTEEACNQLEVFRRYYPAEIFNGETIWLRDIAGDVNACSVAYTGQPLYSSPTIEHDVAGLVLFH